MCIKFQTKKNLPILILTHTAPLNLFEISVWNLLSVIDLRVYMKAYQSAIDFHWMGKNSWKSYRFGTTSHFCMIYACNTPLHIVVQPECISR